MLTATKATTSSSWDAAIAFSFLLSVVAFCSSVFVGYRVSKRRDVPYTQMGLQDNRRFVCCIIIFFYLKFHLFHTWLPSLVQYSNVFVIVHVSDYTILMQWEVFFSFFLLFLFLFSFLFLTLFILDMICGLFPPLNIFIVWASFPCISFG